MPHVPRGKQIWNDTVRNFRGMKMHGFEQSLIIMIRYILRPYTYDVIKICVLDGHHILFVMSFDFVESNLHVCRKPLSSRLNFIS